MRQAHDRGLSGLLNDLEYARERATVQRVLAERDLDRRWTQVRHARKEAAKGSSALRLDFRDATGPGYPSGCPGLFVRSFKQRMILLLSFRLMRTSPRFAYSVPKIGKGPFSPLPDLTRVFSQAGALQHITSGARPLALPRPDALSPLPTAPPGVPCCVRVHDTDAQYLTI